MIVCTVHITSDPHSLLTTVQIGPVRQRDGRHLRVERFVGRIWQVGGRFVPADHAATRGPSYRRRSDAVRWQLRRDGLPAKSGRDGATFAIRSA